MNYLTFFVLIMTAGIEKKKETSIDYWIIPILLTVAKEREREEPNTPPPNETNFYDNNQPSTPPPTPPTTQTIQFTIAQTDKPFPEYNLFYLKTNPFVVNGSTITKITAEGGQQVDNLFQNGDLRVGNTITITNIQLEPGRASIDNGNELWVAGYFADIQIVNQAPGSPPTSPVSPPNNPSFFLEVQQANQALTNEENNFVLLTEQLLEVIDRNKKIVQEGQSLGLSLSTVPIDVLNYFQEEFFTLLDETQPLNSPDNRQIIAANEKIRQKKLNIKTNIYSLYNNNKKTISESKNQPHVPKSELEKLKEETINQINQVLSDKDNLRNINLQTLANGKYQNWEKDINQLTDSDKVIAYSKDFLNTLRTQGAKEKEQENNDNFTSPVLPKKEPQAVDQNFKDKLANLPLTAAKEIAKNKIRELFNKYKPDIQKISKVWQGEKNWMSYLEKCNSAEEVVAFLEKLEQTIIQQHQKSQEVRENKFKKPVATNPWIFRLVIIGLVFIVVLVLILKFRAVYKSGKKKG